MNSNRRVDGDDHADGEERQPADDPQAAANTEPPCMAVAGPAPAAPGDGTPRRPGRGGARRGRRSPGVSHPTGKSLLPLAAAAQRLGLEETALRARCRRAAQREGDKVIARLGPCVAIKFGTSWRVWFEV